MDYGGGYLGDPRGRAESIADTVRDGPRDTGFIAEVSMSDAVKKSSAGNYSTRAQEELTQDLTTEAIRSAPTSGDAWEAVRKARIIGGHATFLGGISALASVHPILAALSLVPQGFITEGASKFLSLGPKRTGKNRFFDALRGDYSGTGSTLSRLNASLWDAILPEEPEEEWSGNTDDWPSLDSLRPSWALRRNDE